MTAPTPALRILTGGQTGVDQAAWRAARSAGLTTAGFMPSRFLDENGPQPALAASYNAQALDSPHFNDRTRANVHAADAILILDSHRSGPGTTLTLDQAKAAGKPYLVIDADHLDDPALIDQVVGWMKTGGFHSLNVAGDRESVVPGIGRKAESFFKSVFENLASPGAGQP